jgi:hypothetical protein
VAGLPREVLSGQRLRGLQEGEKVPHLLSAQIIKQAFGHQAAAVPVELASRPSGECQGGPPLGMVLDKASWKGGWRSSI